MWHLRRFFRPFIVNGSQYNYDEKDPIIENGVLLSSSIKNVRVKISNKNVKQILVEKEKGKEVVIEDTQLITDNCHLTLHISKKNDQNQIDISPIGKKGILKTILLTSERLDRA